jgi:hypothetical protein
MNPMKLKLLAELLSHLDDSQGADLKSLLSEKPEMGGGDGLSVSKVEVGASPLGEEKEDDPLAALSPGGVGTEKAPGEGVEQEMSDDELEELLKTYLK